MSKAFLAHVCFVSFVLASAPRVAEAQLFEPIGVRAQGLGGAFVAVADDATATWWNPAGLATGAYFNSIIEYDRAADPGGMRAGGFAIAFPALGLSYYRLPISEMRPLASTGTPSDGRQDQGVLNQFGASVGQSIGRHLVLASTLKLVQAEGDTHAGLDIGALANFGGFHLGMTVRNARELSFGSGVDELDLSRQVRAGVALMGQGRGAVNQLALALDADLTKTQTVAGDERHVAGGAEIWLAKRRIGVRGGLSANTLGETRTSPSAGVSVAVRSGTYFDGAITTGSDPARKGWGIALRVTF